MTSQEAIVMLEDLARWFSSPVSSTVSALPDDTTFFQDRHDGYCRRCDKVRVFVLTLIVVSNAPKSSLLRPFFFLHLLLIVFVDCFPTASITILFSWLSSFILLLEMVRFMEYMNSLKTLIDHYGKEKISDNQVRWFTKLKIVTLINLNYHWLAEVMIELIAL